MSGVCKCPTSGAPRATPMTPTWYANVWAITPMDSGDVLFDPEVVAKLGRLRRVLARQCARYDADAAGRISVNDPNSLDPDDLEAARNQIALVKRPYIRYFSGTKMLVDMPNREICVAMSWSGDYATAKWRAAEAGLDIDSALHGSQRRHRHVGGWLVYPERREAQRQRLHCLSTLSCDRTSTPRSPMTVNYANANGGSWPLLDPEVRNDPKPFFRRGATMQTLFATTAEDPKKERLRTARVRASQEWNVAMSNDPAFIRIRGISKHFGNFVAVDNVDLDIAARRIVLHSRRVRLRQDDTCYG